MKCFKCKKELRKEHGQLIYISNCFKWKIPKDVWYKHFKNKNDVRLCSKCYQAWTTFFHTRKPSGEHYIWSEAWLIFEGKYLAREVVEFN